MRSLFSIYGKIKRGEFTVTGVILFAIKYNFDRYIALRHDKSWFITDYFMQADHLALSDLGTDDRKFYLLLIAVSVPFIWMGTVLCLKRLRDAGLPLWMVVFFFIPLVNIFFFFMLCLVPTLSLALVADTRPNFLEKIIPRSETGSVLFSIGCTLLIAILFSIFSVNLLQEYGWGLFIGIPFFIGFCSVLLYSYHHQPVTIGKAIGIGVTAVSFFALFLLALALEGLICIAMAAPFGYLIGTIGAVLGFAVQRHSPTASMNCIAVHLVFIPGIMLLEQPAYEVAPVYELKTSVVVNDAPQKVWDHLVSFNTIDPPTEMIFKTGIAYPNDAVIEGKGVGAIRRCNFTTGSFVEPITTWDEPNRLSFDVLRQPQPMFELSFYEHMRTLHLDGYFISKKGEFRLTALNDHQTLLEGTTWYQNKMWPSFYWKQWSDFILHKIHLRVLKHIKRETESGKI